MGIISLEELGFETAIEFMVSLHPLNIAIWIFSICLTFTIVYMLLKWSDKFNEEKLKDSV